MIIGLFGGTFDPPHVGHLHIAQQILDFTECDEVWFVPTNKQNPPKPAQPPERRLAMVEHMVRESNNAKFRVCPLEIEHDLDGKTIHLLPFLPEEHTYNFIIGSDQLPSFHLWSEWQTLLAKIPFLVFPRLGYPNEPLYPNMRMVNDSNLIVTNVSATKIRARVKRSLPVAPFVVKQVEEYIDKNGLYKEAMQKNL